MQIDTDITGKTDRADFNAHVAAAVTTNANSQPAINNLYSLGNSAAKYSQVFSTYFRGTADLAVNAQNLGSAPAADFSSGRLMSYTKAQVDSAISSAKCSTCLRTLLATLLLLMVLHLIPQQVMT